MNVADELADIDATIRYWRSIGVTAEAIAAELGCRAHPSWRMVRGMMIAWALDWQAERQRAA